ncbi:MAG: MmcQ-like protein [Ignavibacteriae bacterium HGW-Ignavibacteriae-2]|jgi:predicted DNA-binding protein (MmcQ/YjbR family)|nr:MAG: MmcQ-like protein [Ignavibacteriae bacterium HGW-Ignavibacteriae-2]
MDLEFLRHYCLKKKGVSESLPFDESTLVFKVMNKIFCLTDIDNPISINLKCEPEKALELRERYEEIKPGYHMNKKHWNTVELNGSLKKNFIIELVDHSYDLVVKGLTKKELKALNEN